MKGNFQSMTTYLHSTTKRGKLARRSNGAVNGKIEGDTFTRQVTRRTHYVWKYKGYGLDALEVERLHAAGICHMRFVERDTKTEYITTVSEFLEHGVRDQLGKFEPQIFMSCSNMSEVKPLEYEAHAVKGIQYNGETMTAVPVYSQETLF